MLIYVQEILCVGDKMFEWARIFICTCFATNVVPDDCYVLLLILYLKISTHKFYSVRV